MNGHTRGYGAAGRFYRRCAEKGMTQSDTARAWGVSRVAVNKWSGQNPDVKFGRKKKVDVSADKLYKNWAGGLETSTAHNQQPGRGPS